MTIKRLICSAAVAVAVIAVATACGKSDETPAASPLDNADQTVVASPSGNTPAAPGGTAPTPRMLAIDRNALLRGSAAGRSIVTQAQNLQRQAETEIKGEADRLRADFQAFQQQSAILAAGVKAQRQRELEARKNALEQKMQSRGGMIQAGMSAAAEQVAHALEPILRQIMQERHADILVDKNAIVLSTRDDMDVTALAIQRLDAKMQTVPVHLVNPQQQQPGAPAAPPSP